MSSSHRLAPRCCRRAKAAGLTAARRDHRRDRPSTSTKSTWPRIRDGASDAEARARALAGARRVGARRLCAGMRRAAPPLARLRSHGAAPKGQQSRTLRGAIRLAVRQLRQRPASRSSPILVLGLGTGAATTVFTVVDFGGAAAAALPAARSARHALGHQPRAGLAHDPISPVNFMDYRALPGLRATRRRGGGRRQPGRSRARSGARQHHRGQRQPVRRARRAPADRRRVSRRRAVLRRATSRSSVISDRLWRTRYNADPLDRRPAAPLERHAVHGRRRDAAEVPLPGRRGRLAAAAVGPDAAQPRRALHGSGVRLTDGHDVRAGAGRGATRWRSGWPDDFPQTNKALGARGSFRCSTSSSATTVRR